ncbi:polysaccharide biosynthesis/export family protein [Candidatus Latescibacterota bacterium]
MFFWKKNILIKFMLIHVFALIALNNLGCGIKPTVSQGETIQQDVILGAGDIINISFFNTPELDDIQTVRPDGKIALKLIGEVDVEGKTPFELQKHLIELYSTQLRNQDITVKIESLYSNRIYVTGEVNIPGVIDPPGRLTALEAIVQAGGFNMNTAKTNKVSVLRFEDGRRILYQLNLKRLLEGEDEESFYLKPFDVVYVPQNNSAVVNRWIGAILPSTIFQSGLIYILATIYFF